MSSYHMTHVLMVALAGCGTMGMVKPYEMGNKQQLMNVMFLKNQGLYNSFAVEKSQARP